MVVCGQTLRQVVAQLELELLRPCQYIIKIIIITPKPVTKPFSPINKNGLNFMDRNPFQIYYIRLNLNWRHLLISFRAIINVFFKSELTVAPVTTISTLVQLAGFCGMLGLSVNSQKTSVLC